MRTTFDSSHSCFFVLLSLSAAALGGCSAAADDTDPTVRVDTSALATESRHHGPTIPAAIAVPAGNRRKLQVDAIGVQIYACTAAGAGASWVFSAPEATLYGHGGHVAGKHYAGPTWQANDGSTVVGAKVAAATPDATTIPWLLLSAASHAGHGKLDEVTFVQRLETTGGLAPATGCDATTVGAVARIPYTATYYFYEAAEPDGDCDDHR